MTYIYLVRGLDGGIVAFENNNKASGIYKVQYLLYLYIIDKSVQANQSKLFFCMKIPLQHIKYQNLENINTM